MKKVVLDTSKIARYVWIGRRDINWYHDCEDVFTKLFGKDRLELVAKLFAATSITTALKSNLTLFRKAYWEIQNNKPIGSYLPNIKLQLELIRAGQPLSGRKIQAFAGGMSGFKDAVVVDIWLCRAFGIYKQSFRNNGKPLSPLPMALPFLDEPMVEEAKAGRMRSASPTTGQYNAVENYVREEAAAMRIEPRQLSAMIWSGVRIDATGNFNTHYKEILTNSLTNLFNVI